MNTHNQDNNLAVWIHLSIFSKYFIPFGNFIFPLVIWASRKEKPFIDEHGRQALNFQISLFLYSIFIFFVCIAAVFVMASAWGIAMPYDNNPVLEMTDFTFSVPILLPIIICLSLYLGLFILNLVCVIQAALKAGNGELYQYPLSIPFIKSSHATKKNPSTNPENKSV